MQKSLSSHAEIEVTLSIFPESMVKLRVNLDSAMACVSVWLAPDSGVVTQEEVGISHFILRSLCLVDSGFVLFEKCGPSNAQ